MADRDDLRALRAENSRLIALLESHGIDWRVRQQPSLPPAEPSRLSTDEKVALFRRLFLGRTDVFPVRWESKTTGKSGYAPACANEWRAGVCEKARIKCSDCANRALIPLSEAVIYRHLAGEGFDHAPLDTLVLAMPVSWRGTLQQYAGRLHREHVSKTDVRIIDFVDTGHPTLLRIRDKRQRGYRAMGYRIEAEAAPYESRLSHWRIKIKSALIYSEKSKHAFNAQNHWHLRHHDHAG